VDPASGPVSRFAVELRALRRRAGSPGYRELALRAHYSATTLAQAARGTSLPSLPVTLAFVRACGGDAAEWETRWRATIAELDPQPTATPGSAVGGCAPYVGLVAFQQEDADRFFGRDTLIADLLTRLRQRRFLGVFGASGCGKSSLLRAGVAAHLAAELDQDGLTGVVFTPGQRPLEECAIHLADFLGESPGTLREEFSADPRNLHLRIRHATIDASAESDVVLIVDQFEELFTLCRDEQERAAFVDALVTATTDPASRTRVVLGVRADFLGHCGQYPSLVTVLRDAQVLMGAMTTEELRLAITGPAEKAGYRVETALVARLIADANHQAGMLPLVSHALLQTWQRRRGKLMTLAGYDTTGGIEHALARTAEQTYQSLDTTQRELTQQIFLRLTALGDGTEDTKRRIPRAELDHNDPNTTQVLDTLAQARLVTLGHDSVEVAHEALIRHWPRLHEWLTDDRDGHRLHRQLTDATTEWERHQRDTGLLYRGARLAAWHDRPLDRLNATEQAFLTTSRRTAERERTARLRRLRWALAAMGIIVSVVSLLAALAVTQTSRATEERDIAFSRQLATNARAQLQVDPELALLLAIKAVETKPTAEADAVLRQAIVDPRPLATVQTGDDTVGDVVISPDGRRIATASLNGTLRVWEKPQRGGGWSTTRELGTASPEPREPAFSPDGRYLAAITGNTVQVWDINHAGKPITIQGPFGTISDLLFNRDGQIVAVEDDRIWHVDPTGGRDPAVLHIPNEDYAAHPYDCTPSPAGRYVACHVIQDDVTLIEDLTRQHNPVQITDKGGSSTRPVFSPDDRRLAIGNADGTVSVWDTTDSHELVTLRIHGNSVNSVEFSPDGTAVISSGSDGTIQITNTSSGANPHASPGPRGAYSLTLHGHQGAVQAATFSRDGRWIASVGSDHTLRIWSATPGEAIALRGHTGLVGDASYTPDALHIVTSSQDGTVRIWNRDGTDPTVIHQYENITGLVAVAVGLDGRLIASIGGNGELHVWDTYTRTTVISDKPNNAQSPPHNYIGVEFTPDGHIVTADANGNIRIWNTDGSSIRHQVNTDVPGDFTAMAVSPVGAYIALVRATGGVRLQSLNRSDAGTELATSGNAATAFSPDGRELATGDNEGAVKIWPTNGHVKPRSLYGHTNKIIGLAYGPHGKYLATSSRDGTIRLWNTTGDTEPIIYHNYYAPIESITFSPDGQHLLTTHADGAVHIQQCTCDTTQQTLAYAKNHTIRQLTPAEEEKFGLSRW
jgi:WD40 repeat protein